MANRYAVASGFADVAATWDGGTLPDATDDVFANGNTVTIRQIFTSNSIRTTADTGILAGGSFDTSGTVNVNAESIAGTKSCLLLNNGSVQNGNSTGGSTSSAYGTYCGAGGTQNGNSTGGSALGAYGTLCDAGGTQNGNSTGGSTPSAYGTYCGAGGTQNGNSTGGGTLGTYGTYCAGGTQNGNSTGGSASGAYGTYCGSVGTQNGNSTGGSASGAHGTYCIGIQNGNSTTSPEGVVGTAVSGTGKLYGPIMLPPPKETLPVGRIISGGV